ncbi:MAG: hypothetical protein KatS3mg077_1230 [Candidatus Binatia bacterium]|nr:MAG: hypothetical protein KatS3mg077_1230 [Candidatus Binatia bacterium]
MAPPNRLTLTHDELSAIGRRIRWFRHHRGWTQQQLAERCNQLRVAMFPSGSLAAIPHVRRDRIAKLELAACRTGRAAANSVLWHELPLLAAALRVPESWLRGSPDGSTVLRWHVRATDSDPEQFADLVAFHEGQVRWTWSETLPCTLMPPSFAEAFFGVLAADWAGPDSPPGERSRIAALMHQIGCANRVRTLHLLEEGSLKFYVTVPLPTITAIANATGHYRTIPRELRAECLAWVIEKVSRFRNNLKLVLATEDDLRPFLPWITSYDSIYVLPAFTSWTDRTGAFYFTEAPPLVNQHRRVVEDIFRRASLRRYAEIVARLREYHQTLSRSTVATSTAVPRAVARRQRARSSHMRVQAGRRAR